MVDIEESMSDDEDMNDVALGSPKVQDTPNMRICDRLGLEGVV